MSIVNVLMVFIACEFNIYGLMFYMSDTRKITDILKRMNNQARVSSALTILAVAISVAYTRICLFAFLILEYIGLLLWYRRKRQDCLRPAFRGVILIIASILTELVILFVYYYYGIENLEYTGKVNLEIKLAGYIGMALIQCIFVISREIGRMHSGYRRKLLITLILKVLVDFLWVYICVGSAAFKCSQLVVPSLFIASLFIDYHAFCIMILRMEERGIQDERANIHVNAYEYYLNMEEEHLRIRKMYHEMKNQLMIMNEGEGFSDTDGLKGMSLKYRNNIQEKLEKMNKFYHTGNTSLDMLLFDGRKKAEARNIAFEAVIEDGCLSFMETEDINIIFSNAIINAIEACEKIKTGPREIKIKAGKNTNDILIYIKNTVSQEREKGTLSTKKKNRKMHGIGLTSIQESVEKYNGYVSIIEEDGTFQLAILFGKG